MNKEMNLDKPVKIFLANCDWRDMFGASHMEFMDKLERDRLGGAFNHFFVFSWARKGYVRTGGRFETVHTNTKLDKFRPLLDIYALFYLPYIVLKYKVKPDIWLSYDFNFIPALFIAKLLRGGKIYLCLNNQPRIYSGTRSFGIVKSFYSYLLEKSYWRFIDHFLTINSTMSSYIKKLGVKENRISVFSMNTIDRDIKFISKAEKGIIRKKHNIPTHAKVLLTVARLEPEKNYKELLDLFATLPADYYLISLGRGGMLDELRAQCIELGISDRVFFEGFVDRNEIWNYYADSDAFVLISKAEALGVVFWEAMYMNIPVLGGDVLGIKESIGESGDRGCVWKHGGDKREFREIIEFLTGHSHEKKEMLERAKKFVNEQLENKININKIFHEDKK